MKIPIESERISGEVRVSFLHNLQRIKERAPFTQAVISWITREGREKSYVGVARVHPNDAPERKIGRKLALTRALWASGLPKDERRQVWTGLIKRGMRV